MTLIVKSCLRWTLGLLFNTRRDLMPMAETLKDGEVTDQKIRNFILRELSDLKSKRGGLARRDLLVSLNFFREGIVFLYQMIDQREVVQTEQLLFDAKKNFQDARRRAIIAFSNEALKTSDRLLAMKIRILATIMEKIDHPAIALESCKLCLEELHNMSVVQNSFSVEITKSVKYWFKKHERREVIADVCEMNYAVHWVTRMVRGDLCDQLPFITIDHLQIDPLRDPRIFKVLKEFKLEHCMLAEWTFGSEGEPSHKLRSPFSITTNTQGQFIVADEENVKVFDPLGKFLYPVLGSETGKLATDRNNNLYLCSDRPGERPEICVLDRSYDLHHRFSLRAGVSEAGSFTISNDDQVFVVVRDDNGVHQVDVYENDGRFVHSFGEDVLSQSWSLHSITTYGDGVMILDAGTKCVHLFSTLGTHLYKLELSECDKYYCGIEFFEPSQHVLILSKNKNKNQGQLSIYTKDGKFIRRVQLDTCEEPVKLSGITVTVEGQVAVTNSDEHKVHVLQL